MNGSGPAFDFDLAYGEDGERRAASVLGWLLDGDARVEVKTKRRTDDWLYVETEQDPGGTGTLWRPSGIATTEAPHWAYVVAETGILIVVPARALRWSVTNGVGRDKECRDGDNPTRGQLLRFARILQDVPTWLAS